MHRMPDILAKICRAKRTEIQKLRCAGMEQLRRRAESAPAPRPFREALCEASRTALIAEVKRASPSAGLIREDFDPVRIASAYERGGATAVSVLTDSQFFSGSPAYLSRIREGVDLPLLRKDFILDHSQVVEARAIGTDAYLLIVAALQPAELSELMEAGRQLGMDPLVEVHDEPEMEAALQAGADLVGINNRDLRTFEVSLETTERLAPLAPREVTLVGESGIETAGDVARLRECGVKAVLVGETLMRARDPEAAARRLSSA